MQRVFVSLILMLSSLSFVAQAEAKELSNRLGLGYSNQFSEELPSMAIRYYPDPKLGVGAALGVDTDEDSSKFGFMVKLYRIIFTEDNMNFYMGTGAGLISTEEDSDADGETESDSGFELSGFAGVEFFLSGLDNLGFSFETGVGVTSIHDEVRFRTIGDSMIKAGMTFYF